MKKFLLLFFLTLLTVVSVQAQNMKLKLWANSSSPKYINSGEFTYSSGTWTYTCSGSDFDTWGVVNKGHVYLLPIVDYNPEKECKLNGFSEYTSSGDTKFFSVSYGDDSGIQLPSNYQNYTFTFVLSNASEGSNKTYTVDLTISWEETVSTSSVYLLGTINSWGNNGHNGTDYPLTLVNGEYKLELTKAQVEGALWQGDFYFRFTENMRDGDSHGVVPDASVVKTPITVDAAYTNAYTTSGDNDSKKDYFWSFTPTGADNYIIYFKNNNGTRQVRVVDDQEEWYLHSNLGGGNDWDGPTDYGLSYNPNTGYYERTLTWTEIKSASNPDMRFRVYNSSGSWGPSSIYAFSTEGTGNCDLTSTSTSNYLSIPKDFSSAKIQAKKVTENNTTKVVVYVTLHYPTYYWVSPQITNGEKWEYFKMVPSRNRSRAGGGDGLADGEISKKYFTFTIKDDDLVTWKTKNAIPGGTKIQWYIVSDDDIVVFRPSTDDPDPGAGNKGTSYSYGGVNDDAMGWRSYMTDNTLNSSTNNYFAFNKGYCDTSNSKAVKSHTFLINSEKGYVFYDYIHKSADETISYDLVGNFNGATGSVDISLSDGREMKPYWYYDNGKVSESIKSPCDSVVYKIEVQKPANGWGDLYIDVNKHDNTTWNENILRPLISLGNNLDGRALHGAMTRCKSEQSLNPEPSPNYQSYTFSFNATTRTYRLDFNMPDATLSPGYDGSNMDFNNTWSKTITVNYSEATKHATAATKCYIAYGNNLSTLTLDETPELAKDKDSFKQFTLTFDGTAIYMGNTKVADGNTIYFKIRGADDSNPEGKGDIHTYQYTFTSTMSFEPHGGLFINSAKITINGGMPPYKYEIWHYNTKTDELGQEVIDYDTNPTKLSEGTFSTGTYANSDNNYRISTPGFLKIIDNTGTAMSYDEVGGGFDFTYSTSENYIRNTGGAITTIDRDDAGAYPNGADYWLARPDDLTRLVAPTSNSANWSYASGTQNITYGAHWSGDNSISYLHLINNTASQTINNLDAGTYTVQAIVRGGAMPVYLDLNDAQVDAISLDGNDVSTISPTGRCERLENMRADDSHGGWRKLEGKATLSSAGDLTIAVRTHDGESIDLADVILLKDANTEGGFRTTASKSETDVALYDYRDRTTTKNNAYSFFDRGKNLNALVYADKHTVIAMDKSLLSDAADYKNVDRKHPFNVVATNGASDTQGVCEVLYLTDKGYGTDINGYIVDYAQPSLTSDPNYAKYGKSGYSFKANLPFTANKVVFDRPFTNVSQTTIMLPFSLTEAQLQSFFGSGVQIWKYTGYTPSTKTLKFEKATDLSANTPYILINASNILDSRVSGKNVEPKTISAHGTEGDQYNSDNLSYSTTVDNEGFYTGIYKYLLVQRTSEDNSGNQYNNYGFNASTGGFSYPKASGAALKPFRCYFSVPADETVTPAASLNVIFEDVVTGISSTETIEIGDNKVYSTNGILMNKDGNLDNLPKGVYIVNGKKYVVK